TLPREASEGADDLPVSSVTWAEAVEFCQRLTVIDRKPYRLPTEAEWEYACRAGIPTAYGGTGRLDDMGWYTENSGGRLHSIGSKGPNHWGLYDMHGNVAEWCLDDYVPLLGHASQTDPLRMKTGDSAVIRGGNAYSPPRNCAAARRISATASSAQRGVGFRVVV